jgi:hypothetical protein
MEHKKRQIYNAAAESSKTSALYGQEYDAYARATGLKSEPTPEPQLYERERGAYERQARPKA